MTTIAKAYNGVREETIDSKCCALEYIVIFYFGPVSPEDVLSLDKKSSYAPLRLIVCSERQLF